MKKSHFIVGYVVTTHNEREEKLFRITNQCCESVRKYHEKSEEINDSYYRMAKTTTKEVNYYLTALYFMDCVNKTPTVDMWDILDQPETW